MTDPNVLELIKQVAAHTAEIGELSRRIGVLEGQLWWMISLLVVTLSTTVANFMFSRKAANGYHKGDSK